MRTLDAGTMGGDTGPGFRIVMLLVTIGGIFIVSTLIGILSNGLEERIENLRKGRSLVLENEHTLILGFTPHVVVSDYGASMPNSPVVEARLRAVPGVQEVSIGHALVADALERAVAFGLGRLRFTRA